LLIYGESAGTIDVSHSIIARNSLPDGSYADVKATSPATFSHSLIGFSDGSGAPLAEAPLGSPDEFGNFIGGSAHGPIDPLLAPLADNGGPTPTHALLPGSPAIGAGDPGFTPGLSGALEFDQRGAPFTRLSGARIDIGAYEAQEAAGALRADFNLDGRVDGGDFLAWQQNLGRTGATIRQGDATADGDVDVHDLAVWRATFGRDESAETGEAVSVQPSAVSQSRAGEGGAEVLDRALAALAPSLFEQREHKPSPHGARLTNVATESNEVVFAGLVRVSDRGARQSVIARLAQRRDATLVPFADELVEEEMGALFNPSPRGRGMGHTLQ
jgi:hypothetical protein